MKDVLHKADTRGLADHGWLLSRHTFSFANYNDRKRMNFGLLRVINDDIVKPAMGFPTHPHANMEIVSIPLSGSLRHQDSMGNKHVIDAGEVQIMSAGTGLTHSEYNNSDKHDVNFLQIWIYPKELDIAPRYGQKRFDNKDRLNHFQVLVSPERSEDSIWINQDAWFSMADLEQGSSVSCQTQSTTNGFYFFIIEGQVEIDANKLEKRDGLGLATANEVTVTATSDAEVLCIEIPMTNR